MSELIQSCLGTKFVTRYNDLMVKVALDAVKTVEVNIDGRTVIDIKKFAKIEKILGGNLKDSCVLNGVMFNKDVCSAKTRRRIENPRIVLLDCPLEYRKAESQTTMELSGETTVTADDVVAAAAVASKMSLGGRALVMKGGDEGCRRRADGDGARVRAGQDGRD